MCAEGRSRDSSLHLLTATVRTGIVMFTQWSRSSHFRFGQLLDNESSTLFVTIKFPASCRRTRCGKELHTVTRPFSEILSPQYERFSECIKEHFSETLIMNGSETFPFPIRHNDCKSGKVVDTCTRTSLDILEAARLRVVTFEQ